MARRAGQNFAFAQLLLWAACNDCVIPGNTYWNVGVAGKGGAVDADGDSEGVGIMQGMARRMVPDDRGPEPNIRSDVICPMHGSETMPLPAHG